MKKMYLGLLLIFFILSAGCISNVPCVTGSGNVTSEARTLETYQSIDLQGTGNLIVTQGSEPSLRVEAEDNLLPYLTTNVTSGVLRVGMNQTCVRNTKPINLYATMKEIKSLSVGGTGSIMSRSPLVSDQISVAITGTGNIDLMINAMTLNSSIAGAGTEKLAGKVRNHRVLITGAGSLEAFDLETASTLIDITGAGNAKVSASENLTVKISGAGTVTYRGNPTVTKEVIGAGTVKPE